MCPPYRYTISRYRGVQGGNGRWTAAMSKSHKNHYLGTFSTEVEAAGACDTAALELHGAGCYLNSVSSAENATYPLPSR